jgi:uncharacterized protein YecA (UPF0149 family)
MTKNVDTKDGTGLESNTSSVTSKSKTVKLGRNDPCFCGSGKKWKKCHFPKTA